MPIYCYEDKDGTAHEEVFPWGKAPKTLTVDGVKFFRCYASERKSVPATAGWPTSAAPTESATEKAASRRPSSLSIMAMSPRFVMSWDV
jgi:hypothetical protein